MNSIQLKLHEKSIKPYFPLQLGSKHFVLALDKITYVLVVNHLLCYYSVKLVRISTKRFPVKNSNSKVIIIFTFLTS